VSTDVLGDYWAIIGVLPNQAIDEETSSKIIKQRKTFTSIGQIKSVEKAVNFGEEMLVQLKEPIKVRGASVVATTTATMGVMSLLALLNGPANLWIILQQLGSAFLGLFFSKKRHRSGIVYDANTGMPVRLVRIDLVDKKDNKIKSTRFTDKNGRYYFLAPKGDYYLSLKKKGYKTVEGNKGYSLKALLQDSDVKLGVKLNESGVIKKNVAILRDDISTHGRIRIISMAVLRCLVNVLFVVGFIISLWSCYVNPVLFNFFIVAVYIVIIFLKRFFAKSPKYGIIVNKNNEPEPFAIINILDAKTKKPVSRVISNTEGKYYVLLEKGEYILHVTTVDGDSVKRRIRVSDKNILAQKLIIKK